MSWMILWEQITDLQHLVILTFVVWA